MTGEGDSGNKPHPGDTVTANYQSQGQVQGTKHFSFEGDLGDGMEAAAAVSSSLAGVEDPVLIELRTQVEELKAASEDNEQRLQEELEVLRGKKKEEDLSRAELKAKTKALEDQKRMTELQRIEAERELNERKSVVRDAQDRVDKLKSEIAKIEKKAIEVEEKKEKKRRDRREREKKLRDDVSKKKEELRATEASMEELSDKVHSLEASIRDRRETLQAKRNDRAARSMGFGMVGAGMPQPPGASGLYRRNQPNLGPYGYSGYPAAYGFSNPSSRPSSIRSGFQTGAPYQSAPSSPTGGATTVNPLEDNAGYSEAANTYYGGAFASPNEIAYRNAHLPQPGFLEHRMQHRRAELSLGQNLPPFAPAAAANTGTSRASEEMPPSFLPFDFESHDGGPFARSGTRPASVHSYEDNSRPRAPLGLPLQYLDSGLLAGSDSPGLEGPLSPMTPHQTSLIPSQLFQMLDEDDEDEFVMPESPTNRSGERDPWAGLKLDVTDELSNPTSPVDGTARKIEVVPSPAVRSPLSPTSPTSPHSNVSSPAPQPLGNGVSDASSPFSPWDSPDQQLGLTQRLSPNDVVDDLPRGGLSLNPDAKAFAFQPRPGARQGHGLRSTSGGSSSSDGILSPNLSSFGSVIGGAPPAKSRMDFSSTNGTTAAGGGTVLGHTASNSGSGSRFSFEWSRKSPGLSSATGSTQQPASVGFGTGTGSAFNPFDDDELLGPLKK